METKVNPYHFETCLPGRVLYFIHKCFKKPCTLRRNWARVPIPGSVSIHYVRNFQDGVRALLAGNGAPSGNSVLFQRAEETTIVLEGPPHE